MAKSSEPDADLQAAKDVLGWVQIALADDQRDQVLQRCRQAEEHLALARTMYGEMGLTLWLAQVEVEPSVTR